MASDLTPAESAILIILMAEAREVLNTELRDNYGLQTRTENRSKLLRLGLMESRKSGQTIALRLTSAGRDRIDKELNFAGSQARALGAALTTLYNSLRNRVLPLTSFKSLSDMFAPSHATVSTLELRIRNAYAELAVEAGGWVGLARLRPFFGDVPTEDLDEALRQLSRADGVNIVPESNQKTLSAKDVAAAVRIGGQAKHLLAIGV